MCQQRPSLDLRQMISFKNCLIPILYSRVLTQVKALIFARKSSGNILCNPDQCPSKWFMAFLLIAIAIGCGQMQAFCRYSVTAGILAWRQWYSRHAKSNPVHLPIGHAGSIKIWFLCVWCRNPPPDTMSTWLLCGQLTRLHVGRVATVIIIHIIWAPSYALVYKVWEPQAKVD